MYAIVEIAGKQFRVSKDMSLKVPRLSADSGSKVEFDKVLFFEDDKGKNQVGSPVINNMIVSATVVEHGRDKKIIIFKKKRRKGYQKKNSHRQGFSLIKIDDLGVVKKAVNAAPKKEVKKDAVEPKPATEDKKAVTKKATTAKKEPAAKKTTTKKAAPQKSTTAKKTAAKPKKEVKPKSTEEKEA